MNVSTGSPYQRINSPQNETKLCIAIDSKTPIITKVPIAPGTLTLGQFKAIAALQDSCYKFYFKSHDSEFGVVKEELVDDESIVPVEGDRVVAWVISNNAVQSSLFDPEGSIDKLKDSQRPERMLIDDDKFHPQLNHNEHVYDQMEPTCLLVNLILDNFNSLGLTVVCLGESPSSTGIFVDSIQPNSIAGRDGRIKIGDKIVEINGVDLRGLKTNEAITIFKQFLGRKGAINLVLQRGDSPSSPNLRNFSSNPQLIDLPVPRISPKSDLVGFNPATDLPLPVLEQEHTPNAPPKPPIRNGSRGTHSLPRSLTPRSLYTTSNLENLTSTNDLRLQLDSRSVYEPTTPTSIRQINVALHCGKDNIYDIYAALKADSHSLDIKDREWLKVVVKDAFLGSALVKWLGRNVYGFCNRSEVKRYANQMLNLGLIRSPMSGATFSEKCYYTLS